MERERFKTKASFSCITSHGEEGEGHIPAPISSFISTGVIICIRKCSQKSQLNKLIRAFHISSKENQVSCLTTQQAAWLAKDFRECSVLSIQTRQLLIELLPRARLRERWEMTRLISVIFVPRHCLRFAAIEQPLLIWKEDEQREFCGLVQPWQLFLLQGNHQLRHNEGRLRGFLLRFTSVSAMAVPYVVAEL